MTVRELIDALTQLPDDMEVAAAREDDDEVLPVLRAVAVMVEREGGFFTLSTPLKPSQGAQRVLVIVS